MTGSVIIILVALAVIIYVKLHVKSKPKKRSYYNSPFWPENYLLFYRILDSFGYLCILIIKIYQDQLVCLSES